MIKIKGQDIIKGLASSCMSVIPRTLKWGEVKQLLNLCMLGNFACFFVAACFKKELLQKKLFGNTISVTNSFDSVQEPYFVKPDLGRDYLQGL